MNTKQYEISNLEKFNYIWKVIWNSNNNFFVHFFICKKPNQLFDKKLTYNIFTHWLQNIDLISFTGAILNVIALASTITYKHANINFFCTLFEYQYWIVRVRINFPICMLLSDIFRSPISYLRKSSQNSCQKIKN